MAIDINELKFNKNDLKFFKKQLAHQNAKITVREMEIIYKIILILQSELFITQDEAISGKIITDRLKNSYGISISTTELRHLISLIRRQTNKLTVSGFDVPGFITATSKGYKISYIDSRQGRKEIISYFQKTQTRWKLTFSELYNLMELLNQFPDEKTK